jgi:hypothetical protein
MPLRATAHLLVEDVRTVCNRLWAFGSLAIDSSWSKRLRAALPGEGEPIQHRDGEAFASRSAREYPLSRIVRA